MTDFDQETYIDEEDDARESDILKLYLDELDDINPDDKVESHLRSVLTLLYDYVDRGVSITDLVCEANLALVETVRKNEDASGAELDKLIEESVRSAIEEMIDETGKTAASDEALAQRVNDLSDLSVEMVQELGRQPTTEELAQRLQIPVDEVDSLIKMSMEAL